MNETASSAPATLSETASAPQASCAKETGASVPSPTNAADLTAALTDATELLHALTTSHAISIGSISGVSKRLDSVLDILEKTNTPQVTAAEQTIVSAVESMFRPGKATTEFYLNALGAVGVLGLTFAGQIPGATAAWVLLASGIVYTASRYALKARGADLAIALRNPPAA